MLLPKECSSRSVHHSKCLPHQATDIPCKLIMLGQQNRDTGDIQNIEKQIKLGLHLKIGQ